MYVPDQMLIAFCYACGRFEPPLDSADQLYDYLDRCPFCEGFTDAVRPAEGAISITDVELFLRVDGEIP